MMLLHLHQPTPPTSTSYELYHVVVETYTDLSDVYIAELYCFDGFLPVSDSQARPPPRSLLARILNKYVMLYPPEEEIYSSIVASRKQSHENNLKGYWRWLTFQADTKYYGGRKTLSNILGVDIFGADRVLLYEVVDRVSYLLRLLI